MKIRFKSCSVSCGCWLTRLVLEVTLVIKLLHLCVPPVRSVFVGSHILLHGALQCSEHALKLFYESALSDFCFLHTPNVTSGSSLEFHKIFCVCLLLTFVLSMILET
jgi:hypothetical protein